MATRRESHPTSRQLTGVCIVQESRTLLHADGSYHDATDECVMYVDYDWGVPIEDNTTWAREGQDGLSSMLCSTNVFIWLECNAAHKSNSICLALADQSSA